MLYRLYQALDFNQLYAIEERCFQPPLRFGRRYMRQLVESPATVTWIAEQGGRLAGFAVVERSRRDGETVAYIQTLEVDPDHRRRGIGLELLRRLESSAREAGAAAIWLHVDEKNVPALHIYRAQGFERQARHEHYYGDGQAAEIYCKPLKAVTEGQ